MPGALYSPPLSRRSSSPRSLIASLAAPPSPTWNASTSYQYGRPTKAASNQNARRAQPEPSASISLAMDPPDEFLSPSFQDLSRSSSPCSSASSSRIATPPLRLTLKPASRCPGSLPHSVDTGLVPSKSERRVAIGHTAASEEVQIIVTKEGTIASQSKSPKSTRSPVQNSSTPPRPPRRSAARRRESSLPSRLSGSDLNDLLPPHIQVRAYSPSADSLSTISEAASTPRAAVCPDRSTSPHNDLSTQSPASEPTVRKRDSAQRRLSALRGLVDSLDFNQPWSLSERPGEIQVEKDLHFWACDGLSSDNAFEPTSQPPSPMVLVHDISPDRPRVRRVTNTALSQSSLDRSSSFSSVLKPVNELSGVTPVRQSPLARKPSFVLPRRPRHLRSSFDLRSKTPEPPRPGSRQRQEVFEVASGGYSKCLQPASPSLLSGPTHSWRSSLISDEVYQRIMRTQGPSEVGRQDIMWEMCETEQAFIKSMRTVMRLFAIPLKTPQGTWIQGISERIAELFDVLGRVVNAHEIVLASQRDMRRRTEVFDVQSFIRTFKAWVPRLEVHERYLLRFEAVVSLVEDNVRDSNSVFGEFVRMQMEEEVLGSMSLGSMLLKPVQRLTKYPLFLRRLLEVTPYPHVCHSEILSVLSMTESMILNLQATKAREEDFEQLQQLGSMIQGLPTGFTLATRGRKLLGQGSVVRVLPQKDLSPSSSSRRTNSLHSSRGSTSSTVSSYSSSPWDFNATSPPSTSRTSQFSISSASSYCPSSVSTSMVHVQTASQSPSTITRSTSSVSSIAEPRSSLSSSSRGYRKKEDILTMLIFNDLILLVTDVPDRSGLFLGKKKTERCWKVVTEVEGGLGKVAEVKDWSGWQGHSSLFTVTISPWTTEANHQSPITVAFTLPTFGSSRQHKAILSCTQLTSLQQFLMVLTQTTTLPDHRHENGDQDTKEVLQAMDQFVM